MNTRYLYALLLFVTGGLIFVQHSLGQTNEEQPSFNYPVALQRLQLKLISSYVYFCLQGQIDADSAALLVSEGENLPYSLYYDEDYREGADNEIKESLKQGNYYLFKAGSSKKDLDRALTYLLSAKLEAEKTGDIYWRNAALGALGKFYQQSNDLSESKFYFTEAVDLARNARNPIILAGALANRGTHAGYDDPQKEKDLTEALKLSRQQGDKVGEIEMLTRIYEIYFVRHKLDTVRKQLLQVTELEKSIGYKHLHYNHYVLAYMNYYLGTYADVFFETKMAIAIMEGNHDFAFSNFFYGAMANLYANFDDEKAIEWLNKSVKAESVNKAKRIWYSYFIGVALNIAKHGHPKRAVDLLNTIQNYPPISLHDKMRISHAMAYSYQHLNQMDHSEKYYDILLPYLDSLPNDTQQRDHLFFAYLDLAEYRLAVGDIDLSTKHFQKGKTLADTNNISQMSRIHLMQFKFDSSAGNYEKALKEYHSARILEDSIFNLRKAKQFDELQVQYETESKDKNIQLLVQKDKIQQATLRQSTLIRNFTLAGTLVMALITALLYSQYRSKQKRNKEMNEKNTELEQLVKDKEWLVKEIHHRVKNNFHIVASLLEIQTSYLKNKAAISAIKESQHRINSMSIIHQKLYQSETLSTVNMPEYIYELVEYLKESYAIREKIIFDLQIENIELSHSFAITLGLILNEAITNAIKYAFHDTHEGKICISLNHISDSQILLIVQDNGPGLPKDFVKRQGASMGMELLQGLTDDIGGIFSIENNSGTCIKIIFHKEISPKEISFS